MNQPLPVGLVDAASPEDYLKYKSSFEPTPQKEEVPLPLQLANKTKERSNVLAQIERERVLVRIREAHRNFDSAHGTKMLASKED